jgi:hypothetical protein
MPDLYHSLLGHDLGHLRIVAELWGLPLASNDQEDAAKELAASLLDPKLAAELMDSLPSRAKGALTALAHAEGRIPWATFVRQFGDIREMGAAKRDRERPHLKPASTAEILFYRALLARAFFDSKNGPQEFAYIPGDLTLVLRAGALQTAAPQKAEPLGREAVPGERAYVIPADDRLPDDATTLLAALRIGRDVTPDPMLLSLLHAAGLLRKNVPQAEAVQRFLEASRPDALKMLVEAWRISETFNELRLMPGLVCEGEWKNQTPAARRFLLNLLATLPAGKWWSLSSFIVAVKQKHPDFQRPAGDYDSWFIKREADGAYLRGFAAWDEVDGALIRFFITRILQRFGIVELASPGQGKEAAAFRLAARNPRSSKIENGKLKISSNGQLVAPRFTPRAVRYQLARFCDWGEERPDEYRYQITPKSLTRAKGQGLKVEHLLALLAKYADAGIPPVLVKALKRWEVNGPEALAETQVVLRVSKPEILGALRKSKAARFLGEALGPTSVLIKAGAQSKVMAALAELGLLAEDRTE